MICPHCNKPIPRFRTRPSDVDPKIKKKAVELYSKGFSMRDIEHALNRQISIATISRILKEQK